MSERNKMRELDNIRRDLIQKADKKFDKTIVAVSDAKSVHADRKEGEVWTDGGGKQWTIKNGIRQSISKLQSVRMPWWCPKCTKTMNHRLDRKFWNLYQMCMDCTIAWHTRMKIDGTYDAWEQKIMRENEKSFLIDKIQEREDYIRTFRTPQAHYGDGRWDELAGKSMFEGMFEEVRQDIEACKKRLQEILDIESTEAASI